MKEGAATALPIESLAIRDALLVESIRAQGKHVGSRTWRRREPRAAISGQYSMLDVALFLEKVYHLSDQDEHGAVDAVYNFMDDCLLDSDFTACHAALLSAVPERLRDSVILSFLIVTQRAKGKLAKSRAGFYDRAFATVSARDGAKYAEKLLENNR
jgi:hypothetical protein